MAEDGKKIKCPKRERVIRDLRNYLSGPECPANGWLPRETELAARFGVTRRTFRFALDVLEEENMIERIHGKGTFKTHRRQENNCIYFLVPCADYAIHAGTTSGPFLNRLYSHLLSEGTRRNVRIITIPFSRTNDSKAIDYDALDMIPCGSMVFVPSIWFMQGFPYLLERDCSIVLLSPFRYDPSLTGNKKIHLFQLGGQNTRLEADDFFAHGGKRLAVAGKYLRRDGNFSLDGYRQALEERGIEFNPELVWEIDYDFADWNRFQVQMRAFYEKNHFDGLLIDIPMDFEFDSRFSLAGNLNLPEQTVIYTSWEYPWHSFLKKNSPFVTYDYRIICREIVECFFAPSNDENIKSFMPFIYNG